MLFIVAAVLIGVISRMGEEGTVATIVPGPPTSSAPAS